jgi:uncharacterized protein
MLRPDDEQIARELRSRLSSIVTIEEFWVYGSRARGDATDESDFDVYLVVQNLTPALRREIDEVMWKVGFDWDRIITSIVATREQVERGPFGANPLLLAIEREGVAI